MQRRHGLIALRNKKVKFAQNNADLCSGLSDEEIDQAIPAMMHAAQLDDPAAAYCYLRTFGSASMTDVLTNNPNWIEDFKQNALDIANTAVENGDWSMVDQLKHAYFPQSDGVDSYCRK